jgi:hypothetical protein
MNDDGLDLVWRVHPWQRGQTIAGGRVDTNHNTSVPIPHAQISRRSAASRLTRQYRSRDVSRAETGNFQDFLRIRAGVAEQLSAEQPSNDRPLANHQEFLEGNPARRNYPEQHPAVQQQLAQDSQSVMTSAGTTRGMPKTKTRPAKPEPITMRAKDPGGWGNASHSDST